MKALFLCLLSCFMLPGASGQTKKEEVCVKYIAPPIYAAIARHDGMKLEGTVEVQVEIAADGKVISAKGSGAHEILNRISEDNVRQWTFCPAKSNSKLTITYVWKLEGEETYNPRPTRIILELPHYVEVIAQPLKPDTSSGLIHEVLHNMASSKNIGSR